MKVPERKPRPNSIREWLRLILCGSAMGAADLVPGVSGGTMAFITGIYESFIKSITSFDATALRRLMRFDLRGVGQHVAWEFLSALLFGILLSLVTLTPVIHRLLDDPTGRTLLFSLFLGLILGSVWFCARQIPQWRSRHFFALVVAAIAAFIFSGSKAPPLEASNDEAMYDVEVSSSQLQLKPENPPLLNYDYSRQQILNVSETTLAAMLAKGEVVPTTQAVEKNTGRKGPAHTFVEARSYPLFNIWFFLSGAIAICAMLLPGVSGSYLLTILGSYTLFISALADFIHALKQVQFDVPAFFSLFSFGCGILVGVVLFSRLIRYLLLHYHNTTIAALTGFMIGAVRAVWPFNHHSFALNPLRLVQGPQLVVLDPSLPDPYAWISYAALALALFGFGLVFTLERMAAKHS